MEINEPYASLWRLVSRIEEAIQEGYLLGIGGNLASHPLEC
jgi:hypothetical protein